MAGGSLDIDDLSTPIENEGGMATLGSIVATAVPGMAVQLRVILIKN